MQQKDRISGNPKISFNLLEVFDTTARRVGLLILHTPEWSSPIFWVCLLVISLITKIERIVWIAVDTPETVAVKPKGPRPKASPTAMATAMNE